MLYKNNFITFPDIKDNIGRLIADFHHIFKAKLTPEIYLWHKYCYVISNTITQNYAPAH